jgi:hypothetical protein
MVYAGDVHIDAPDTGLRQVNTGQRGAFTTDSYCQKESPDVAIRAFSLLVALCA